jgi:hypothetical protein
LFASAHQTTPTHHNTTGRSPSTFAHNHRTLSSGIVAKKQQPQRKKILVSYLTYFCTGIKTSGKWELFPFDLFFSFSFFPFDLILYNDCWFGFVGLFLGDVFHVV